MFNVHAHGVATRHLLAGGLVGPPLFVASILIEGATRPGYSAWSNYASQLSLSSQGWEQIVNFIVFGALMLGFAVGAGRAMPAGKGSTWAPMLLGLFGLAMVLAGIFVIDPGNGYPVGVPAQTTLH